jgi:hypothetical protein
VRGGCGWLIPLARWYDGRQGRIDGCIGVLPPLFYSLVCPRIVGNIPCPRNPPRFLVGLLFGRTRPFAVVGALLMHGFVMASIGPWGHDWNTVVWPWNAAMVAFVLVLFWRPRDVPSPLSILLPGRSPFRWAVIVLFAFLPLLSFWDRWDSYLSASLYSGNTKEGFMVTRKPHGGEPKRTDLFDVTLDRLNVPIYPEEEVFESAARAHCSEAKRPGRTRLVILGKPDIWSGKREREVIHCRELLGRPPRCARRAPFSRPRSPSYNTTRSGTRSLGPSLPPIFAPYLPGVREYAFSESRLPLLRFRQLGDLQEKVRPEPNTSPASSEPLPTSAASGTFVTAPKFSSTARRGSHGGRQSQHAVERVGR